MKNLMCTMPGCVRGLSWHRVGARLCFLAAAVVLMSLTSATAQNLLTNPGFEDPITADGPPFVGFWEAFAGDGDPFSGDVLAVNDSVMPRSGALAMDLVIGANFPNSFAGMFQDVPGLSAGQEVTWSGWHKSLLEPGGTEIRIEWRDSVNDIEISRTPNFAPIPGADYEPFALTALVPAGADTARVVYAIQSFGAAAGQQVFVDDVSVTAIPEPAAMTLLGIAGSVLLFRLRSRS